MTSTSEKPIATGHFMLTLCRLAAPVSIRPPQSPQLKRFTFFMSRAREPDGSERFDLNMGYFETLADAERRLEAVRRHYPNAFATIAPVEVKDESLTDTQVLRILDARGVSSVQDDVEKRDCDQIALLRPDDTSTRQALKEAVVQGAPVSFAVQLHWSAQPIDLNRVPSLAIFKAHTLYATERRREGRSRHFLRLGFFADPVSAKLVAVQVRSTFASAAVVPIVEQEVARAREACLGSSAIPYLVEGGVDQGINSNSTPGSPEPSRPLSAETVKQKPNPLAEREMWAHSDSLSESGVRHLRVEVQEHSSGRWRIVRFGDTPSNMEDIY